MITLLLTFMRSHLPLSCLIISTSLLFSVIVFERWEIGTLRMENRECKAESQALSSSNVALLASLREQNAAVAVMRAESQRKKAVSEAALRKARQRTLMTAKDIRSIQGFDSSMDECKALKALIAHYAIP